LCNEDYKGGATAITSSLHGIVGYTTCVAATISNAGYSDPTDNTKVYTCDTGYAAANALTSCIAFTTDSNCRQLDSTNAYCLTCWHSYYFNAGVCVLKAGVVALSGLALALLAFFN